MSDYKLVPFEPTPEMVSAAEDAYMPFGDMDLALRMAILAAPDVQVDPVGWQFYQDGKWWNGDDRIKNHRKNTVAAGIPVRYLYAVPQPAPFDGLQGCGMDNLYATDGKCHNSQPGTFGAECGQPAEWVGTTADGFRSGFCDDCKNHGYEARYCADWSRTGGES